jgi:hypothetical protein
VLYANKFHNQISPRSITNFTLVRSEIDEKRTVQYCTYRIRIVTRTHPVGCIFGCVACALHSLIALSVRWFVCMFVVAEQLIVRGTPVIDVLSKLQSSSRFYHGGYTHFTRVVRTMSHLLLFPQKRQSEA